MQTELQVNQLFVENMRQLWRHDAKLAHRVDLVPIDAGLEVTEARRGGALTAQVRTDDGRALYLHSRHDPVREAADFCENLEGGDALTFIVAGMGLGYHVKALFERHGDEIVVVVTEPDLVTIKTALEHTDLAAILETGRLVFVTDLDKSTLHEKLGRHSTLLMLGTCFVVPPAARDHHAEFHAECREAITDYAAFARMSLVTLVKNAAVTCRNIANNLPTYVATPPADVLRRKYEGRPAILVAAGPSLSRNVDQLRGVEDRAVIIAAQTTLRPLLERGIRPHFVTSLDFSDLSRQFFEGVDIPDDVILVAEPKASYEVVDAFRGGPSLAGRRVILLDNEFAHRCLGEALAKRTPMEAGSTVMHLAFYLAEWLGCDPIIFIGQDLGFTGHCYYTPGVAIHRAWGPETGRFCTLEMKEWERIARHRPILRKTTDVEGRDIYTDDQMFTYLEQFERDFAASSSRIIDATEGGVCKRGASSMPLAEALERFCGSSAARVDSPSAGRSWYDHSRLAAASEVLATRRRDLEKFRSICTEMRELLSELGSLIEDPPAFNRRLVRVDELRTKVQRHDEIYRMVTAVSQLGELQKYSADSRIKLEGVRGQDRAGRQLDRDRRFIDAMLAGCDTLGGILDGAIARFEAARESPS